MPLSIPSESVEERECRPMENAWPSTPPASPVPELPGEARQGLQDFLPPSLMRAGDAGLGGAPHPPSEEALGVRVSGHVCVCVCS